MLDSNDADGHLSPDKAAELRSILSDPVMAEGIVDCFSRLMADEVTARDPNTTEFARNVYSLEAKSNVALIFKHSESPIETIFLNSFLCSCARFYLPVIVTPPPSGDFLEFRQRMLKYWENLFCCYSFYDHLPDDAKPKDFRSFLEVTGVERGGLTPEEASALCNEAVVMFDLKEIHWLHVTPQASLIKGGIRADAILWIPTSSMQMLVVECDGYEHHADKDSFVKDRIRDRKINGLGLQVRRYSGSEIHRQPIQASSDLAQYVSAEARKAKHKPVHWERRLLKRPSCYPTPEVSQSWRERLGNA